VRTSRGQATVEYVAALALLVCVLAGAGVAVAAPDLPGAVVGRLRLALCMVAGDVCRTSDAAARGLEPCVVAGEDHAQESGVSLLVFRSSGGETWSIQRRSDGSILLSAGYGQGLDLVGGVGLQLGPVEAIGEVSAGAGFRSGRTWELPDEATLRRLLDRVHGFDLASDLHTVTAGFPAPTSTFLEGGGHAGAQLGAEAIRELAAVGGDARKILGRREDAGGTTFYMDLGADTSGLLADLVPGLDRHARVLAEYRTGARPALTLRTTARGNGSEETETVLRLPLATAADRAAARRVAFLHHADPTVPLRELVARVHERGTVERLGYRTTVDADDWAYGVALGVKLGVDHAHSIIYRELVDAQVLGGRLPAQRFDCVGA